MTGGFYEQLGLAADATAAQLRAAYTAGVQRLARRRAALADQGGDTAQIDLARAQLDEAMGVLSDPVRRRRYDAMLAWTGEPDLADPVQALWVHVAPSLVHPAAASAVRLLRQTTQLGLGHKVPVAPSAAEGDPPTLIPADEDLTSPRIPHRPLPTTPPLSEPDPMRNPRLATPAPPPRATSPALPTAAPPRSKPAKPRVEQAPVVPLPVVPAVAAPPSSGLKVVDPAVPVVVLPPPATRRPTSVTPRSEKLVSAHEIARLVDEHGHSGGLFAAVRAARGISLQDMSDTTRIAVRYLEALETEAFDALPSPTFVRGYVREIARLLKLDEEATVAGYMKRLQG